MLDSYAMGMLATQMSAMSIRISIFRCDVSKHLHCRFALVCFALERYTVRGTTPTIAMALLLAANDLRYL